MKLLALCIFLLGLIGCGAASSDATAGADDPIDPLARVPGEFLFDAGVQLARRGDWLRAEQYLAAASARGYPEAEVVPWLVEVCLRDSRYRSALVYAQPYLRRQPDDWRMRLLVASVHLGLDEADAAEEQLTIALQQAPDAPAVHYLMAVLHRDARRNPRVAASHFERYLQLAPSGEHALEARMGAAWTEPDDADSASEQDANAAQPTPAPIATQPTQEAPSVPLPQATPTPHIPASVPAPVQEPATTGGSR